MSLGASGWFLSKVSNYIILHGAQLTINYAHNHRAVRSHTQWTARSGAFISSFSHYAKGLNHHYSHCEVYPYVLNITYVTAKRGRYNHTNGLQNRVWSIEVLNVSSFCARVLMIAFKCNKNIGSGIKFLFVREGVWAKLEELSMMHSFTTEWEKTVKIFSST